MYQCLVFYCGNILHDRRLIHNLRMTSLSLLHFPESESGLKKQITGPIVIVVDWTPFKWSLVSPKSSILICLQLIGEANEELVDPTAKKAKFDSEVEQTEDIPKQIGRETQPLNPKEVKNIKEDTNLLPTSSTEAVIKDATKLEDAKDITQPIEKETGGKRAREEAESAEGRLLSSWYCV